jgi:hypothetical protein
MGNLVGGALSAVGGILGGNSAADAARKQAAALTAAGQTAFDASRFRPVGITTAFGSSNFTTDPTTGALTQAGYTLTPEMRAIQQRLLSQAGGTGLDLSAQGLTGAQSLFNLGQGYLAESPEAVAQQWMKSQQALLQPGRDTSYANMQQNLFNSGRGGLSIAQGGNLGASNPEAQAYYNAMAQQDAALAANAQEQGRAQTKFGASLFGAGADAATAGYSPLQTALTGASSIENLGQKALGLGMDIGNTATSANARAAAMRLGMAAPAATAQYSADKWNPWASALSSAGNAISGMNFGGGGAPTADLSTVGYAGPDRGMWF